MAPGQPLKAVASLLRIFVAVLGLGSTPWGGAATRYFIRPGIEIAAGCAAIPGCQKVFGARINSSIAPRHGPWANTHFTFCEHGRQRLGGISKLKAVILKKSLVAGA